MTLCSISQSKLQSLFILPALKQFGESLEYAQRSIVPAGRSPEFAWPLRRFFSDTQLLGAIPELDSMAVVSLIAGLEDRFGITVDDDEIEGSTFATVGSLVEFVDGKLLG